MKTTVLTLLILFCLLIASTASAQLTAPLEQTPVDSCAGLTMDECTGAAANPWWCFWCPKQQPKLDCTKLPNKDCTSCKAVCDCNYSNKVQDCDGMVCRDNALVDRDGCYGNCYHDYLDVC